MSPRPKNEIDRGGRPPKFGEPSKPVTVTLPLRILERLALIDADRAKAIVKATDKALAPVPADTPAVCELSAADGETLLAVADSPLLRGIPWLRLIEVAPGRHLLSLHPDVPVEKLEVTLGDLIDASPEAPPAEMALLRDLLERLRKPRRNRAVRTESILVIRNAP